MNTDKTLFICFKQNAAIFKLKDKPLKLEEHFTYLGSNISSIDNDVNVRIRKVCTSIDRLSMMLKSDLSDKIKRLFYQAVAMSNNFMAAPVWTLTKSV